MEGKKITIDEDKLRRIIFESIKKVINEDLEEAGYDYDKMKSNNAVYAEEEGFQRGQYFCRSNKMEPVVLKYLSMSYFQVIDNEWHHTGKTYKKTSYYAWKKPEYKQIYQTNKAKIDNLILQYNAAVNIKNRVSEAVLREKLLKQLDNGAYEPRKLKRSKVKETLLSFRSTLPRAGMLLFGSV